MGSHMHCDDCNTFYDSTRIHSCPTPSERANVVSRDAEWGLLPTVRNTMTMQEAEELRRRFTAEVSQEGTIVITDEDMVVRYFDVQTEPDPPKVAMGEPKKRPRRG